jgi:hypothetical protein
VTSFATNYPDVGVDFETFYEGDYSVRSMTYTQYVTDIRFNAYCVSVSDGEKSVACHPEDFDFYSIWDKVWVSHNRPFDMAVYNRLVELGKAPRLRSELNWHCSAALCRYLQLPASLDKAAWQCLGMKLDKQVRAEAEGFTGDLFGEMEEYAEGDAIACIKLWRALERWWI